MTTFWKVRYRFVVDGGQTDIQVAATNMAEAETKAIRRLRERFGAVQVAFVAAWKFSPPQRYFDVEHGRDMRIAAGAVCCHWFAMLGALIAVGGLHVAVVGLCAVLPWLVAHGWVFVVLVAVIIAAVPVALLWMEDRERARLYVESFRAAEPPEMISPEGGTTNHIWTHTSHRAGSLSLPSLEGPSQS